MKSEQRRTALSIRKELGEAARRKFSSLITEKLLSLPEYQKAENILCYASYKSEVETDKLCEQIIADGKKLYLPRCDIETKSLIPVRILDVTRLEKGAYGIPEPKGEGVAAEIIDFVIVPMVAFDRRKMRLGYGGGYYDRFLPKTNADRCAIAFSVQEMPKLVTEPTDLPMDMIVTEREVIV